MPPLKKLLSKLSPKDETIALQIIRLILKGDTKDLNVKKLKGLKDMFRIRKGKLRIIYEMSGDTVVVVAIERRSDTTYKKL